MSMNHDNCHCFDCDDSCPDECYRAQLTRDLKPNMIVTFAHLRGTKDCPMFDWIPTTSENADILKNAKRNTSKT